MKIFILLLLSLSSNLVSAQRSTGSGGVMDVPPIVHIYEKPLILKETDPIQHIELNLRGGGHSAGNQLADLAKIINARNVLCHNFGTKGVEMKGMSFLEIHLSLKLLKSSLSANDKCPISDHIFACLITPELKTVITKTLESKEVKTYLKGQKLSQTEIKEMIKFFKTVHKKCGPDDCQM